MIFYRLKKSQYLILFMIILACLGYVLVDQNFIPEKIRPVAFLLVSFGALFVFFIIVKPDNPFQLSRTLSLILGIVDLIIIVIFHIIITFDISYKNFIILGTGILAPFIDGLFYKLIFKKKA